MAQHILPRKLKTLSQQRKWELNIQEERGHYKGMTYVESKRKAFTQMQYA